MSEPQQATHSLRRRLLLGILVPVIAFISFNTYSLYHQTLASLHTAYDRTLLASAKSISEQLDVEGYDDEAQIRAIVPYSALEAFEADNQSHMFYRISTQGGEVISGFGDLPEWRGKIPLKPPYAALVDFYDDVFRDQPVRVAVLLQPVASAEGRGMAVIQVAETLEVRETLALQILWKTLMRQALLIAVIAFTVLWVVQRATRPVRHLSLQLQARGEGDLSPIAAPTAPRELQPLIAATNQVMQRLRHLLRHQKRFVRDASHQLRTHLTTLQMQVDYARREPNGDWCSRHCKPWEPKLPAPPAARSNCWPWGAATQPPWISRPWTCPACCARSLWNCYPRHAPSRSTLAFSRPPPRMPWPWPMPT